MAVILNEKFKGENTLGLTHQLGELSGNERTRVFWRACGYQEIGYVESEHLYAGKVKHAYSLAKELT